MSHFSKSGGGGFGPYSSPPDPPLWLTLLMGLNPILMGSKKQHMLWKKLMWEIQFNSKILDVTVTKSQHNTSAQTTKLKPSIEQTSVKLSNSTTDCPVRTSPNCMVEYRAGGPVHVLATGL